MNRGIIDIDKARICGNCAHFTQHNVWDSFNSKYAPIHVGHCAYPRQKDRCTFEYCSNYVSGETAAYLKAEDARKEKAAVEEYRQQYRKEKASTAHSTG